MRQRWMPVAALAAALFVINAVARLIVWKADIAKDTEQTRIGMITFGAISVLCVAAAAWWALRYPLDRVAADLLAAGVTAAVLSVVLGPLFSGKPVFDGGFGMVLGQLVLYLALAGLGAGLGILGVIAVGRDWKTRAWKRHEESLNAKRNRVR
ncbi:hypothetical protein AB0M43_33490 [Longispora sp. NPDC051575]|uniref:hypothetical protein n=1 Tax=Longispora sp. NPDC051575 TaxID=3154943 RepID=UPI003439B693